MSLEAALSIVAAIVLAVLPLCIKIKGEPFPVSKRVLLLLVGLLTFGLILSVTIGFPIDLRIQLSPINNSDIGDGVGKNIEASAPSDLPETPAQLTT